MASYSRNRAVRGFDGITASVFFSLLFIGWMMLISVGFSDVGREGFTVLEALQDSTTLFYGLALGAFSLGLIIDYKFWNSVAPIIYSIAIVLLLGVLIFGIEVKGATSWFSLGGFSFQPSELAKWSTLLLLSSYLGLAGVNIQQRRSLFIAIGIVVLPILLILLQPDAGSALVFTALGFVFYRAGLNPVVFLALFSLIGVVIGALLWGIALTVPIILLLSMLLLIVQHKQTTPFIAVWALLLLVFVAFGSYVETWYITAALLAVFLAFAVYTAIRNRVQPVVMASLITLLAIVVAFGSDFGYNNILRPHQQDRINVWLHPEKCDPQGSLYNVIQSKTAIGSGGTLGKGFLQGTMTKLNYVPEQSTDFIYSTLGEEHGFIGSLGVMLLFLILLIRITVLAERSKNTFIQYYGYGIAGYLFFQIVVNIGMTMGLMPVIGIPLPFISKGGTALVIFSFMIGTFLRMDMDRNKR